MRMNSSLALGLSLIAVLSRGSLFPSASAAENSAPSRADADAGKTVVYRDEFGVPHIYAETVERGLYAMGYAQAEDRLEELLKNFLRATGEMSAAFGESNLQDDVVSRVWDHDGVARRNFERIHPEVRRHWEAFVRGINDYLERHRNEVPDWWGPRRADVFMCIAHSRQFMWGWPLGQAISDLRAAGLSPDFNVDLRSSNEWVVGPARTSVRAPILLIDPHLSWWGASRFWEFRMHAGVWQGSGFTLPGSMYVGLGHNDHLAWAMTTGGPDTSDIYELTLNPADRRQYRYDHEWKELKSREVEIRVRGESKPRRVTVYESHHGPVVAKRGDKAYVAKLSYAEEVQFGEMFYHFNFAKNIAEFKRGLELNQIMPQNVMAADTAGDIFYQRAGRVPIRPAGFDFSKPVDGSISASEWLGIHPARDLLQITNPPQGYMQNCNIPPDAMMIDSPLKMDPKQPDLFGESAGWTQQRGARAVQLLAQDASVTPEEARRYAVDEHCYGFERWVAALGSAHRQFGAAFQDNPDYQAALNEIEKWDGFARAGSTAALKFHFWRTAVNRGLGAKIREVNAQLNDFMAAVRRSEVRPGSLTPEQQKALTQGLADGMATLRRAFGRLDVTFGEVFRVGRGDQSWPVGGGSLVEEGMGTLRAIRFENPRPDHTRWGTSGQTSTQIIILTRPIQSWTQPPIGQSDRPDSPFYRDQAEKLFSRGQMKPTWYAKDELLKHVHSRTELSPPF